MQEGIDICICTFNRVHYLKQCVEKLLPQLSHENVMLTIVNNNSSDQTEDYVQSLVSKFNFVRYFFEPSQGISHARNRGWKESQHKWIFYIDDECLPGPSLLSEAFACINSHPEVTAIGGPIYPVMNDEEPGWLPEGFGEFKLPFEQFTIIDKEYIRCGCFLIQRDVFNTVKGFSEQLGMKGYTLAYGEELELQDRLRASGYKIGYAPTLAIHHQVRVEKLNLGWIIQSEYARRRDKMLFTPGGKGKAILNLIRTLAGRVLWTPVYLISIPVKQNYSWQNAVLDIMRPLAYRWGEVVGTFKRK